MAQLVKVVATMGVKDVAGSLSAILKDMQKGDEKVIGVIHGKANGISYRSNKFGEEPSKALCGQFEGRPNDPDGAIVKSARVFLPSNIQNIIISSLEPRLNNRDKVPKKAPPIGKGIDFEAADGIVIPIKILVGIRKTDTDGGGVGYEFITAMPQGVEANDALSDTREEAIAMLAGNNALKALASPDKAKSKTKKK